MKKHSYGIRKDALAPRARTAQEPSTSPACAISYTLEQQWSSLRQREQSWREGQAKLVGSWVSRRSRQTYVRNARASVLVGNSPREMTVCLLSVGVVVVGGARSMVSWTKGDVQSAGWCHSCSPLEDGSAREVNKSRRHHSNSG